MHKNKKLITTSAYYGGILSLGLVIASIGPSLPTLAVHTNTELSKMGFLFTMISLGYLTGSLIGGKLYDKSLGHPLLAGSLIIFSFTMVLIPLIRFLLLLVAVLLLLGIAEGMLDVGCNTLLVWVHKRSVGPYMNGLHFFFGVGALTSPLIVGHFLQVTGNIKWAYWLIALFFIPLTIFIFRLKSPAVPPPTHHDDNRQKDPYLILLVAFFFFLHVGAESSFGGWIYSYSLKRGIATTTTAAWVTSVFWGSLTTGRLAAVPISIKLKPEHMLLSDLIGCIGAALLLHIWPHSVSILWIGSILMGAFIASLFPTGLNYLEQKMHISGSTTSWILGGSSMGSMFFPWIIGRSFKTFGLSVFPLIMLAVFVVALLLLLSIFYYAHSRRISR